MFIHIINILPRNNVYYLKTNKANLTNNNHDHNNCRHLRHSRRRGQQRLDSHESDWSRAKELGLDRKVTFVALSGGGVIGDINGMVVGLCRLRVPAVRTSTLFGGVPAHRGRGHGGLLSVGGKTSVDRPLGKNTIDWGLSFVDRPQLMHRPVRPSEVVKYGLVSGRGALF